MDENVVAHNRLELNPRWVWILGYFFVYILVLQQHLAALGHECISKIDDGSLYL